LSGGAGNALPRKMALGLLLGAGLGVAAHLVAAGAPWLESLIANVTEPAGQLFLRMLFALVIPLIVSALPLGVTGLGDLRRVGRLGLRTLAYTVTTSAIAVALGVTLVNLFAPGVRVHAEAPAPAAAPAPAPSGEGFGVDFFLQLVPKNPVEAMARGDMLAVMVFSLFLGIGLAATRTAGARRLEEVLQGVYDVVTTLLGWVIQLAPYGVFCLLFTATARMGVDVLRDLAAYVAVVLLALAIQMFGVYSLLLQWLGRTSPLAFFRGSREAIITAFSTASSNATLPTALRVADRSLALPKHVSHFVLTIGSTTNQHGTALFEGVTVLFLAQVAGVELTVAQQLGVAAICVLGGIGTAGVPAGSIPVIAMILGMVGVPPESIGLVLGVDRFLDMCRTTVNVTGDLAAAVVIARYEEQEAPAAAAERVG
jgi:DAACS family dicarboxylate/amino acid:cation (Na+ or H+) symporter